MEEATRRRGERGGMGWVEEATRRRGERGGMGWVEEATRRRGERGGVEEVEETTRGARGARRGGRGGRDNAGSAGIGVVLELVDDSPNPIFQDGNVEVDQQSEALVGDAQIGVKLNGKKRSQFD